MALQLSKPNPYGGSDVTYWKIADLNINYSSQTSHISLLGFIDKKARDQGKQAVMSVSFDWSGENFPFDESELKKVDKTGRVLAYATIKKSRLDSQGKETNKFVNAVDV